MNNVNMSLGSFLKLAEAAQQFNSMFCRSSLVSDDYRVILTDSRSSRDGKNHISFQMVGEKNE